MTKRINLIQTHEVEISDGYLAIYEIYEDHSFKSLIAKFRFEHISKLKIVNDHLVIELQRNGRNLFQVIELLFENNEAFLTDLQQASNQLIEY